MQEVRVVTIDEEFEELQKGRGPDKKPRKRKGSPMFDRKSAKIRHQASVEDRHAEAVRLSDKRHLKHIKKRGMRKEDFERWLLKPSETKSDRSIFHF